MIYYSSILIQEQGLRGAKFDGKAKKEKEKERKSKEKAILKLYKFGVSVEELANDFDMSIEGVKKVVKF